MARGVATQNKIVGLYESGTYGAVSGNFWPDLVISHNVEPREGIIVYPYIGGVGRDVDRFDVTNINFRGQLVVRPQSMRWLMFALGSNVDAGSPSPYTHVLSTINNDVGNANTSGTLNPFISFGIEESNAVPGTGTNFVRTIKGAIVDEFELAGEQGQPLTATINYIATSGAWSSGTPTVFNNFSYGTSSTTGSITDRPYIFNDVVSHIPSGTVFETMTAFKFKTSNHLIERSYLVGSRNDAAPQPDQRDILLDLTFDAQSEKWKTLYENYYVGGSSFNAMLFVNASTGSRDNAIILSGCRILDPFESPLEVRGINQHVVHIQATSVIGNVNDLLMRYNPW